MLVAGALEHLKLEPKESTMPGSPSEFVVTDETLEFLKGKTISVSAAGKVTIG